MAWRSRSSPSSPGCRRLLGPSGTVGGGTHPTRSGALRTQPDRNHRHAVAFVLYAALLVAALCALRGSGDAAATPDRPVARTGPAGSHATSGARRQAPVTIAEVPVRTSHPDVAAAHRHDDDARPAATTTTATTSTTTTTTTAPVAQAEATGAVATTGRSPTTTTRPGGAPALAPVRHRGAGHQPGERGHGDLHRRRPGGRHGPGHRPGDVHLRPAGPAVPGCRRRQTEVVTAGRTGGHANSGRPRGATLIR